MSLRRYWRVNVASVVSANYVQIMLVELAGAIGSANLATHPGTGTASSSSTQNGSSTWCWNANGGWTSLVGGAFPQWTQFDFGVETEVVQIKITNSPTAAACAQTCTLQTSDNGSTWTDEVSFTNSATADAVTTIYFGPTAHATIDVAAPISSVFSGGAGFSHISAPPPTIEAYSGAALSLAAPLPVVASASGALLTLTAPSTTLLSLGHESSGENAITARSPSPTLTITTGANAKLTAPKPALALTATATIWGKSAVMSPAPTLASTGTVSAMADAALSAPSSNLIGYSGAVCSITTASKHTVVGTGRIGSVGGITATAPLFTLTASATRQNSGSAILTAPVGRLATTGAAWIVAPGATLTAVGTAVVTATYEAYALNLNHPPAQRGIPEIDELTRYTNFPFTHIVRYQNSYYGANSTGLYLLEGTTDDGAPIEWEVKTAFTDFDSAQHKTLEMAYFGGRLGPEATISLFAGEQTTNPYEYTTPRGAAAQNYRQPFGRGQKARYYALGASGDDVVTIDSITLNVATLARKV